MNILITGGSGFIGSKLALECLEKGQFVRVLGQENTDAEAENKELIVSKGVEFISGSVTDEKKVFTALEGIDVVYHLAAAQHEANVSDRVFWEVNVTGTENLLKTSVNAGVKKFIHGSTIGVYGSGAEGELSEESQLRPDNIYGKTKLEGEKAVLKYKDQIPVVIIRISETYGPGDRRLLKLFKAIKKNVFFIIGSGKNKHHLIYIDDLINGFLLSSDSINANGEIFVLAGRDILSTNDMFAAIAGTLGKKTPQLHLPFLPFLWVASIMEAVLRPLGIQPPLHRRRLDFFKKNLYFSRDKTNRVLNFSPKYTFAEGARRTADWYMDKKML